MKKVFLMLAVIMLCFSAANAQFTKGTKMFSGNLTGLGLGFTKIKDVDNTQISFSLMGKGSYFLIDNLALTAGLGFDYLKLGDNNTNAFALEIGGRYYLVKGLYAALAYEGLGGKDSDWGSFGKIDIGYDIFISEKVFFEPAAYFRKGFGDAAEDISQFGLSVGVGIKF